MTGFPYQHPNDGATLTVKELRAGARAASVKRWPEGSPNGSDNRHEARCLVDEVIDETLRLRAVAYARALAAGWEG